MIFGILLFGMFIGLISLLIGYWYVGLFVFALYNLSDIYFITQILVPYVIYKIRKYKMQHYLKMIEMTQIPEDQTKLIAQSIDQFKIYENYITSILDARIRGYTAGRLLVSRGINGILAAYFGSRLLQGRKGGMR